MNPWKERTLVITVRWAPDARQADVWLTLFDAGEVGDQTKISQRGGLGLDDLPYAHGDILLSLLEWESSRYPRLV